MKEINIVTSNENRFQFVKKALEPFNIKVNKQAMNLNEIQADTVEEVALQKAIDAAKKINAPCICEDTELTITSLNNFPGPYMKFAQSKLDLNKIVKLIENEKDKTAIFKSILVYASPDGKTKSFETKLDCEIISKPKGTGGRDWDSIILIKKSKKTLAEYEYEEKFKLWSKGYINFGKWYSKSVDDE